MNKSNSISEPTRLTCPSCGTLFALPAGIAIPVDLAAAPDPAASDAGPQTPIETMCPQCGKAIILTPETRRALAEHIAQAAPASLAHAEVSSSDPPVPSHASDTPQEAPTPLLVADPRLRQLVGYANGLGLFTAFWAIVFPFPQFLLAGVCAFMPLAVLAAVATSKGALRLIDAKTNPAPTLAAAFLGPVSAFALRAAFDFRLESYSPLLGPVAAAAAFMAFLVWRAAPDVRALRTNFLIAVPFILLYAFGAVIHINGFFDPSEWTPHQATVLERSISGGRSKAYFLTLSPWGPRQENNELDPGRLVFEEVQPGDVVIVNLKSGLLGIPWYVVTTKK